MPFTNQYDVTFPPDTQLANLLGSDLRNLALNVQQRMAVISGVSAGLPNFVGDAQPANWNGILFFATDIGHIYQFNNPNWLDVTGNFLAASQLPIKFTNQVNNTGNTTQNVIYSPNFIAGSLGVNTQLRITTFFTLSVGSGNSATIDFTIAGQSLTGGAGFIVTQPYATGGPAVRLTMTGGNVGSLTAQRWCGELLIGGLNPVIIYQTLLTSTTINFATGQGGALKCQNNANTLSTTFNSLIIEFL